MAIPVIELIKSKKIYQGRVATLSLDTCKTAEGHRFIREIIHHPPSVVIVPLLPNKRVLLIKQFRHAAGKNIYEIPAGTSETGESLLHCAKRELAEETGYTAKKWKRLCQFYPAPGISTERMALYQANGLSLLKNPPAKDQDEYITTESLPIAQAMKLIKTNRIIDAKTIVGLLWGLNRVKW
jgi:ADP-ribose pyrophosphatase